MAVPELEAVRDLADTVAVPDDEDVRDLSDRVAVPEPEDVAVRDRAD